MNRDSDENSYALKLSAENNAEQQSFEGSVRRITFRSEETGFGVLRVKADTAQENTSSREVTVVGIIPHDISAGSCVLVTGDWTTHPKFGRQFKAVSVMQREPRSEAAIARYLGSGLIKGLGPKLAERVVEKFGSRTLEILDDEPEKLTRISGIGRKKLEEITQSWLVRKNVREVFLFLQEYQIPIGLAQRIFKRYGDHAIETLKKDPYVLAKDLWGVGFTTADRVAQKLGIEHTSQLRIRAGFIHILKRAADDGHCYLSGAQLVEKTTKLLAVDDHDALVAVLGQMVSEEQLIEEAERFYLKRVYEQEALVASLISDKLLAEDALEEPSKEARSEANKRLLDEGFELSAEQRTAVSLALRERLTVITGGPGCGKTTVVRTIADVFRRTGAKLKLAAPTGRAAQRLSEVCGIEASTIHRLLRFDPIERAFLYNADDQLDCDAIIVDECSMIDLSLASSLFQALRTDCRLILVGDVDQLPSVGAGLVLADLLSVPEISRVRLTKLFRRAEESAITAVAYQINSGEIPAIPSPDGEVRSDAYFIEARDAAKAAQLIERLVVERIPATASIQPSQITVLTPMNQGELGTASLNRKLQARVVPKLPGSPELEVGDLRFRLGDRVCQRVNNYQLLEAGVFNGDQGVVTGVDPKERTLQVELWDGREVEYPNEYLHQLDLAYALTIHRSQGSEMGIVVLALHDAHTILLERQLLYTAVTRAKELLIIVGSKKALATAVKRVRSRKRQTTLSKRIQEKITNGN